MAKEGFIVILFLLLFISLTSISAAPIDDEFKKLANYAGEYETGNIDYVQLLIYTSSIRERMNEILGATGREIGGVLKQEQIKKILGEPVEETKWVWLEGEEKETKLDNAVPVWKKIVFDGRRIQIRLNAWPSIFSKKEFKEKSENKDEKNEELEDLEGKLIYRLNFEIEFKKPEEQLNIQSKIDDIQTLAQNFNSDPSSGNAEALAKESVNAERTFESYFRQSGGKCEDILGSIFGTENKRQTQQLLVQEVSFCEGDNFEVIARLEMCDECEWYWINLDFWFEGRGPGFKPKEGETNIVSPKNFENMNSAEFEGEVRKIIDEIKHSCDNGDFSSIMSAKNKLWPLNEAWNQKSNNVWEEIDKTFKSQVESMTQEQRQEFDQNYGWIKQEQEKRQKVKELSKTNYEARKQFYLNLFSGYDKKEYYFTQIEFEKRLVEEFKERGEEICDNNEDDNENEAIDCADEQCGGKICGKQTVTIEVSNNETSGTSETIKTGEEVRELYCIQKTCQLKEEIIEIRPVICGNHLCEENESIETCAEDCSICPVYPAINCSGRVIFSGNAENGCPLEPKCIEEVCSVNEDCKFLCGEGECVEGKCEVKELKECEESECIAGDKKILNCQTGEEIIVEECIEGLWKETGIKCEIKAEENCESYCASQPHIMCVGHPDISGTYPDCSCGWICETEEIAGGECTTRGDCGGENDVCTNGKCETLPEAIPVEPEEPEITQPEGEQVEQETTEPQITAGVIFTFFRTLFLKATITGKAITGFQTEEGIDNGDISSEQGNEFEEEQEDEGTQEGQQESEGERRDDERIEEPREDRREEDEDREREDEKREEENKERCKKECKRPCVEKCIRGECGEKMECDVNEVQKKCEGTCEAGDDCVEKCMQGGEWWKEFENKDEHKEEKGVFQVGGNCRTSQGKTEGFIWFGGWGVPFEQIQPLKNKYYSGGQADWCKYDFENLKKQRQEFEKGFNQEFVAWFFERYLANSAENWEQSVSGIFELYWKDVDNSREMAYRMQCLEIDELPSINLINVKYDTKYGSIEFWEEIKTVKLEGMDKEVQVISPYMKVWIFPPKEFIVYEMKQSMKNHEFPGPPEEKLERKNEEGPTAEEREMIKQDEKFMSEIRKISEKYGGNLDISIQFKDYETNEIIFNLHAQVNEYDIMKIEPMLPEEVSAEDVKVEIDFKIIYDMIYTQEKEMRGEMIESPPWDKKIRPMQKIKEVVNGVKMYFKIRKIMNSAKITPVESEKDVKNLFKKFISMMMKGKEGPGGSPKEESDHKKNGESNGVKEDIWESKEVITGEVMLS